MTACMENDITSDRLLSAPIRVVTLWRRWGKKGDQEPWSVGDPRKAWVNNERALGIWRVIFSKQTQTTGHADSSSIQNIMELSARSPTQYSAESYITMLLSGDYKIQNFFLDSRFIHMQADGTVVGSNEADAVELVVKDEVLGLATLFDKLRDRYIVIDKKTGHVVGSVEPQVLQFSTEGEGKYIIHKMDVNEVWVLDNNKAAWTPIFTAPAPPPSVKDYQKKYWLFERMCE